MERFDLLHNIHKALRHAMLTFNIESGRTDYSDPEAVTALRTTWTQLTVNLGQHAAHEDEIMFPLLSDRAPGEPRDPFGWQGEVDALVEDHVRIQQLEAEMDKLLARIEESPDGGTRRLMGRELHRSIQRYTAMALLHFDDEERHYMPRMWALYTDAELVETFEKVMAVARPEERAYVAEHLAQALDPVELAELRAQMPATS